MVTVVMITYGHEKYIREAIDGVLMQQCDFAVELLLANDSSPDNSDIVIHDIMKNHPKSNRIRYVKHEKNIGMMPNFLFALKEAKGKYIARLDDHDIWTDVHKLSKQVALLEKDSTIGVVGTAIQLGSRTIINPVTDRAIRNQMLFRCPLSHVTVVFRRDLFERVGGYDESLKYSEDWDLWMKLGLLSKLRFQRRNAIKTWNVLKEDFII